MADFHSKITGDGSLTIFSEKFNESYHSVHGAISESLHVFIEAGFKFHEAEELYIFEMGFGTGLNVLLTCIESLKVNKPVHYTSIELFPLNPDFSCKLNYPELLGSGKEIFHKINFTPWEKYNQITSHFYLKKIKADLLNYSLTENYDIIYFDAFSPKTQPGIWSPGVINKIAASMKPGGIFTTYSSSGQVKRNLTEAGLVVEKLAGPAGKREMIRAVKEKLKMNKIAII